MSPVKDFFKLLTVYSTEYKKAHFGNMSDGGYVLLEDLCQDVNSLFSYGIGNDISFEVDLYEKFKICSHCFDHTVEGLPKHSLPDNYITFKKEGLSSRKKSESDSLEHHLFQYAVPNEKRILKMDIEWHEWEILDNMDIRTLDNFEQIVIEFHIIPVQYNMVHTEYFTSFHKSIYSMINSKLFTFYAGALKKFSNFYCFHLHGNNSLPLIEIEGLKFPPLLEASFVKKSLIRGAVKDESCLPDKRIDYPNKPYKAELEPFYPFNV